MHLVVNVRKSLVWNLPINSFVPFAYLAMVWCGRTTKRCPTQLTWQIKPNENVTYLWIINANQLFQKHILIERTHLVITLKSSATALADFNLTRPIWTLGRAYCYRVRCWTYFNSIINSQQYWLSNLYWNKYKKKKFY